MWIYNKNVWFELWKNSIKERERKVETALEDKAKKYI